jgi:hypothetical protein
MASSQENSVKSLESLDETDEILFNRYPTPRELERFPLSEKLLRLDKMVWTKEVRCLELDSDELDSIDFGSDEKEIAKNLTKNLIKGNKTLNHEVIKEVFRKHIIGCMEGIRILTTGERIEDFLINFQPRVEAFAKFQNLLNTFLLAFKEHELQFLRFVTLYHDIGKVIHRDKHPMLSKHVLESMEENNRKIFLHIFDKESEFYSMLALVGHHDLFGNFCTGEASKTAYIEASGLRLRKIEEAKKIIDYLLVLNMADIYGTIGPLSKERVSMIMDDWTYFNEVIQSKDIRSKSELENRIIESEQEPEKNVERLKRILISSVMYGEKTLLNREARSVLCEKITSDLIRSTLMKQLGPELQTFCRDFALICKLDYALRFMTSLSDKWISKNKISIDKIETCRLELEILVNTILEVLIRLVRCYSDLTRRQDGGRRIIGLELLSLSRSKELSDQVIDLLLSNQKSEGVNWVADETTAWYYL